MYREIDRARPLADAFRRQFVGTLGFATLGIATLGLAGLWRGMKSIAAISNHSGDFNREHCLAETDQDSERTLYEIVYFDKRLDSYWPVGFEPGLSGAVAAVTFGEATQRSVRNG